MRFRSGCLGFTLTELLVVIALIAIIEMIAVPAFTTLSQSMRLTESVNALFSSLILARSEAIKLNSRAVVCKSVSGEDCTTIGGWEQGWIVFHDTNGNALVDAGETILLRQQALASSIRFTATNPVTNYVSFTPTGGARYTSGGFQAGTFTVCQQSEISGDARQIVLSSTGRPRTVRTIVNNCT